MIRSIKYTFMKEKNITNFKDIKFKKMFLRNKIFAEIIRIIKEETKIS